MHFHLHVFEPSLDTDAAREWFSQSTHIDAHTLKQTYPLSDSSNNSLPFSSSLYENINGTHVCIPIVSDALALSDVDISLDIENDWFANGEIFDAYETVFRSVPCVVLVDKERRNESCRWARHALDLTARLVLECAPKTYAVGLTGDDHYALVVEHAGRGLASLESVPDDAVKRVQDSLHACGWRAGDILKRDNWTVQDDTATYTFVDYNTLLRIRS
jgi:hypothetical protein